MYAIYAYIFHLFSWICTAVFQGTKKDTGLFVVRESKTDEWAQWEDIQKEKEQKDEINVLKKKKKKTEVYV